MYGTSVPDKIKLRRPGPVSLDEQKEKGFYIKKYISMVKKRVNVVSTNMSGTKCPVSFMQTLNLCQGIRSQTLKTVQEIPGLILDS